MKWQLIVARTRTAVFGMLFLAGTASAELRVMNDQGGEVSSTCERSMKCAQVASVLSSRRHSTSDAALSSGNPRLDQPTWRAHPAAHDNARPGSGGVLPALRLKQESVIFIFVVFVLLLLAPTCLRGGSPHAA